MKWSLGDHDGIIIISFSQKSLFGKRSDLDVRFPEFQASREREERGRRRTHGNLDSINFGCFSFLSLPGGREKSFFAYLTTLARSLRGNKFLRKVNFPFPLPFFFTLSLGLFSRLLYELEEESGTEVRSLMFRKNVAMDWKFHRAEKWK